MGPGATSTVAVERWPSGLKVRATPTGDGILRTGGTRPETVEGGVSAAQGGPPVRRGDEHVPQAGHPSAATAPPPHWVSRNWLVAAKRS
ncbi:MAG: hypothetical protein Q9170_007051 [Blastenia crenularia]